MKPKTLGLAVLFGLSVAIAAPAVADEWNQRTIFTFSGAVELPGQTLPGGTYVFTLMDSGSDRHIVRVFNQDESRLITTLLAVPAQRAEPADEPMVNFAERTAAAAPAVQYWFYPGRTIGHEFVYPKQQAMKIAKASHKPVLATDATGDGDNMARGKVTTIDPEGRETAYTEREIEQEPATRASNERATSTMQSGQSTMQSGQSVNTEARREMTPERRDDTTMTDRTATLPATASGDPMLLVLAVSSLLGLAGIGGLRRRS
jgi:LPXTG-motif cell wall-anchored protein